jgi:hypothetical protein
VPRTASIRDIHGHLPSHTRTAAQHDDLIALKCILRLPVLVFLDGSARILINRFGYRGTVISSRVANF